MPQSVSSGNPGMMDDANNSPAPALGRGADRKPVTMTMTRRLRPMLFLLALVATGAGCGGGGTRNVTMDTWREGVETYVNDTGKGDPAVLRDTTYRGRPAFAQIGNPISAEGTDAVGVLLGHRPVAGRPSFIYLVGLVAKEKAQDIRLAVAQAIPSQGGKTQFKWLTGKEEKDPTQRYLNYRKQLFTQRFPGRSDVPPEYTSFPAAEDAFDLNVTPAQVTATHKASGATWTLPTLAK